MSKIDINKINDMDAIRLNRQNDLNQVGKNISAAVENKVRISEDKLEFSPKAAEFGKLVDQIKQFPDVRSEKVEDLKVRIAAGEYNPSGEEIAAAIMTDEIIR